MNSQRFILLLFIVGSFAMTLRPLQTNLLNGAWRLTGPSGETILLTMADNYLMETVYEPNRYVSTRGGTYQMAGDKLTLLVEFDTNDSSRVGKTQAYQTNLRNDQLGISSQSVKQTFTRIEEKSTPLTGLWRITGRANDAGQITTMQRGPRKTIKLLTGSRFQWAAINPQTKQFSGTGGGTYTLKDGQYTETIDFFSRDNSRVGRSLTFSTEINGTEWHHTGQSSTGGTVNEIWSREK
ncbi:membrane or secreted protein [Spirosoma validum]|uniref:Membrane or secreted protein n=1 Tax=Spirosoma validum TaxID=2771355 RepID=A0A927B4E4_9BACT|nr:membrane or secreted protein [Spirosoma validum]MBD2755071.1 membrane or secreted protein [Spirosoma validum]